MRWGMHNTGILRSRRRLWVGACLIAALAFGAISGQLAHEHPHDHGELEAECALCVGVDGKAGSPNHQSPLRSATMQPHLLATERPPAPLTHHAALAQPRAPPKTSLTNT